MTDIVTSVSEIPVRQIGPGIGATRCSSPPTPSRPASAPCCAGSCCQAAGIRPLAHARDLKPEAEELPKIVKLRRALAAVDKIQAMELVLGRLSKFPTNAAFLKSF